MKSTANKISNVDIAVYALYLLGGVGRKVHLEEIAVKCHKMAAGRFAFELSRYNEHPDKHAVFCALADARKPQIGGLIEGKLAPGRRAVIAKENIKLPNLALSG